MQIKQENDGHAVIDQLTGEEVLTCAINIGEQLLMSGAEISRVEDTIRRICAAYGIRQSHIFSIASCIIVTLETKDHKWITQTRRILSYGTDMWKLDRLNNLSRLICSTKPPLERINREYALILNGPVYPPVGDQVTAKQETNLRTEPSTASDDTIVGKLHNGEALTRIATGDNGTDPDNIVRIYRNKNESHFF